MKSAKNNNSKSFQPRGCQKLLMQRKVSKIHLIVITIIIIEMMIIFLIVYLLFIYQIFAFKNNYSFILNNNSIHSMNSKFLSYSKKAPKQNLLIARCDEFDRRKNHRLNPTQLKKYNRFNILNYFRYSITVSNKMHENNQVHYHTQSSLSINHQSSNNNSSVRDLFDVPSEELGKFNLYDIMCDDSEHRKQCEIVSDEFSPIYDFDVFME